MVQDPHKVLGVPENATQDEIKKAYRKKAKEYHPDLHPNDPDATRKMNEINEAYDMLINPEKYARRQAQQQNSTRSQGGNGSYQGPGGWASDFGGFDFEDIFGFGRYYENTDGQPQHEPGDSTAIRQAVDAIGQGRYQEAIRLLDTVPGGERSGRWYYLSALANQGSGNTVLALEQIRRACQLEPTNAVYQQTHRQFTQAGQAYRQNGQWHQMDLVQMQRLCIGACSAYMLCRFCC